MMEVIPQEMKEIKESQIKSNLIYLNKTKKEKEKMKIINTIGILKELCKKRNKNEPIRSGRLSLYRENDKKKCHIPSKL